MWSTLFAASTRTSSWEALSCAQCSSRNSVGLTSADGGAEVSDEHPNEASGEERAPLSPDAKPCGEPALGRVSQLA